jgi:FimV-like protein
MTNKRRFSADAVLDDKKPATVITSRDIRAIAGDDMMVTQLDLARAYIELGKKKLAKQILDHVIKHGNPVQQQSARQLMASF